MAKFSNHSTLQSQSAKGSRVVARMNTPYVSKGASAHLTEKERLARQINKTGMSGVGMNTDMAQSGSFFSVQLGTDFLELPQSLRERREIYQHFYESDEMVGQAIDLHTELPLSKIRLAAPKPRTCPKGFKDPHDYGKYILSRFERMCKKIKLMQRLYTIVHHYWLDGTAVAFAEDSTVSVPVEIGHIPRVDRKVYLDDDEGEDSEQETTSESDPNWSPRVNREDLELSYYQKHYAGWERLIVLPIDRVKVTQFSFTDKVKVELIPSDRDRELIEKADLGDPIAQEMIQEMPEEVLQHLREGRDIPLGNDPDEGSFVALISGRKSADSYMGNSILDRCHIPGTKVLVKRDGNLLQVSIEELNPDVDLVLSAKGEWREFEVGSRHVENLPLMAIFPQKMNYNPVISTVDHRYPVLRGGEEMEVEARFVREGDFVLVPKPPLTQSKTHIDICGVSHPVTPELAYALAFWMCSVFEDNDGRLTLQESFLINWEAVEKEFLPFLAKLGVTWKKEGKGYVFEPSPVVEWLASELGTLEMIKRVPAWIYDTSPESIKGFLRGWCDSEGWVALNHSSATVYFRAVTDALIEQVRLLCLAVGYPASIRRIWDEMGGRSVWTASFSAGLKIWDLFDSGYLAKRRPINHVSRRGSSNFTKEVNGKLWYRVMKRDPVQPFTGNVYSLNVHEDHTFFANCVGTCNCLRTLYYREKLRQAQTSIASRAMTPKRIVWSEGLSSSQVDELKEQVDYALVDPDYSIVTNYEVHWEEMGARDRLLDLSSEYETADRRLITGLGVTETLMSGESLYSGDRLKLEVINQRYMHLREIIQEYVETQLFEPVSRRMGFVEQDEWGQEVVLCPRLSFTRLPLRDSQDTFDALYNMYQKGSVSVDLILEMLNIDPEDTKVKIERDLFTVNDALFNELMRTIYGEVGRTLTEKTDITGRLAQYLKLKVAPAPAAEEESRF